MTKPTGNPTGRPPLPPERKARKRMFSLPPDVDDRLDLEAALAQRSKSSIVAGALLQAFRTGKY